MGLTTLCLRLATAASFAVAALALGCASTPLGEGTALENEYAGAPDWVVHECSSYWGDPENWICGVGSAAGSKNVSLMRQTATSRGRVEIARSLQTRIESMLKDYQATTTGGQDFGEAANDEQHIVDVSREITDMTLSGTQMATTWISQNGTFYALVALDVDKFSDSVSRMDQLSEAIREAVVERADQSFAELNDAIDKGRAR